MKRLILLVLVQLMLVSASDAVTWSVVTVSNVVSQSGTQITATVLSSRKYLDEAARRSGAPLKDLFIGFREDTGEVAVVRISTETIIYNIVSGLGTGGTAANTLGSKGITSLPATVSSLNTDFVGYIYDTFTRKSDGSLKSVSRLLIGGSGNQTIKGTIRSTGKKFIL